jgi:hypothetical protein
LQVGKGYAVDRTRREAPRISVEAYDRDPEFYKFMPAVRKGGRVRPVWCGAVAVAISVFAAEAAADILTCVGPTGEVLYSNIGCPSGYSVRATAAETGVSPAAPTPAAVPAEPLPPPEPPPPPRAQETVDESCSTGTFQTVEAPGAIDVRFTNSGARACLRVKFYCLWGLGFGSSFYKQSDTGSYEGRIDAGATVRVGEMTPSGPGAGDVSWSWCSIR